MAVGVAQDFLRRMAQPLRREDLIGTTLLQVHQIQDALHAFKFA